MMRIKQDYVSSQYHQIYFTFTASEVNNVFDEVIALYDIKEENTKKQKRYINELVMERIEDIIIEDEITKLDIIPVCGRKYRYLTEINRNKKLLVIVQFCILPEGIQLRFPSKIPSDLFKLPQEIDILKDFTKQILLANEEYDFKETNVVDQKSVVKYTIWYTKDDFVINEIKNQTINIDDVDQPNRLFFLNAKVDDVVVLDEEDGITVKAHIDEIKTKALKKLSNEIVERLNFLNTKTVTEFRQKIRDIFSFSTTVVLLLNYLTEFIMKNDDVIFDEYVINHFMDSEFMPKKKKDVAPYIEDIKKEIIREYIIWIINLNYQDDDVKYMDKIIEEYEFDKILFRNPNRIDSYQNYINRHVFEVRVLEYCIEQKILEIQFL